jgi:hypothetical protein
MEEQFIKGVIGGTIAAFAKDIPDALVHMIFKITKLSFWDYSGIIATGKHPVGILEQVYAFGYEVIFSIFLGIIYANIAPHINTKHYLLRGAIYGAMVWFVIRMAVIAYQITALFNEDINTAIAHSIGSILFGMVLAWVVNFLQKKEKRKPNNGR